MVGWKPRTSITCKLLECYEYAPGLRLPQPVLKAKLYNLALEPLGEVSLAIDTGFEGSVMVPRDVYDHFLVAELPRSLWRAYKTLTGVVEMRVARALLEVAGKRIEVYVESPVYGGGRYLVGREVLNKLTLLLDGVHGRTCIVGEWGD